MIHSNTAAGDCEHKFLLDVVVCPGYNVAFSCKFNVNCVQQEQEVVSSAECQPPLAAVAVHCTVHCTGGGGDDLLPPLNSVPYSCLVSFL